MGVPATWPLGARQAGASGVGRAAPTGEVMSDKTWKARERKTAAMLGGKRIAVTGERNGADVETALLCIQQKHGRRRPAFLSDWLSGICANAQPKGKVGLVVWSANRERQGDAIVIMRLSDFQQLHGPVASRDEEPCP
jgi:hypothetical protein